MSQESVLSTDAASQRIMQLLWTCFGSAALMLFAVSACELLPLASYAPASPSSLFPTVAFNPSVLGPGAIHPAKHPIPVSLSGRARFGGNRGAAPGSVSLSAKERSVGQAHSSKPIPPSRGHQQIFPHLSQRLRKGIPAEAAWLQYFYAARAPLTPPPPIDVPQLPKIFLTGALSSSEPDFEAVEWLHHIYGSSSPPKRSTPLAADQVDWLDLLRIPQTSRTFRYR